MRRKAPPYTLADLVGSSLSALGLEQKIREQTAIILWNDLVGEQVAGAAQPEFVRNGILFVVVKNAVWANELGFYKRDIISRINKRLKKSAIRDIVFRVGSLPSPRGLKVNSRAKCGDIEGISLSDEEIEQVESIARTVNDPRLFNSLRGLLITVLRQEKWKKENGWKRCSKCGALHNGQCSVCSLCRIK
ncbi:MAG: DUF721 domain-containing protein [Armatimonadetes bacterium]|nr:DUF721 domain-containing protein [Armatimonadota bacterium]